MTAEQMREAALLPCPFCGKPAKIYGTNMVGCEDTVNCGGQVDWGHYTRVDGPMAAWNRRALPLPDAAPRVKALEWVAGTYYTRDNDSKDDNTVRALQCWDADGYKVIYQGGPHGLYFARFGKVNLPVVHTLELAKAAAQADYEARILSALAPLPEPQPGETGGKVAEAARVLLAAGDLPANAVAAAHHKIDWCRSDHDTSRPDCRHPDGGTSCAKDVQDAWTAALRALAGREG